jgi:hypothetical protein
VAVGNLHLGASYLHADAQWRLKVGGAIEYGPWTNNFSPNALLAIETGHPAWGGENLGLWAPEVLSIVTPTRFEYGDKLVGSIDAAFGLHFPTNGDGTTQFSIQLSPGIGYYVSDTVLLGARLPFTWVPTSSGSDSTFLAAEPYARFDFGQGFVDVAFMLNLDKPYGFAFDQGEYWAIHVGGGLSF